MPDQDRDAVLGAALASIVGLARGASIELSTRNLAEIDQSVHLLAAGSDVYVPCLPATPLHYILSVAKRVREHGLNPVPHFAARRLVSAAVAAHFLTRLREEADVRRVLLIAGDNEVAAGPFSSSLALMQSGVLQASGMTSVGVAGYPEGHRRIAQAAIDEALERKIDYARAHALEPFIVSQFCFDGRQVLEWLAALRARGVGVPVRVGVTGPSLVRSVLKYGMRCGIGSSLRVVLGARPVSIARLLEWHGPERLVRQLAPAAPALGVTGLHLLPFGGFARTALWVNQVAAGRIELRAPEHDFVLQEVDSGA